MGHRRAAGRRRGREDCEGEHRQRHHWEQAPSLRFKGVSGTEYNVSLFNDKELVGTAVLTTSSTGGARDRSRSVKLEKEG